VEYRDSRCEDAKRVLDTAVCKTIAQIPLHLACLPLERTLSIFLSAIDTCWPSPFSSMELMLLVGVVDRLVISSLGGNWN
jgi:hypothetical protein